MKYNAPKTKMKYNAPDEKFFHEVSRMLEEFRAFSEKSALSDYPSKARALEAAHARAVISGRLVNAAAFLLMLRAYREGEMPYLQLASPEYRFRYHGDEYSINPDTTPCSIYVWHQRVWAVVQRVDRLAEVVAGYPARLEKRKKGERRAA